MFPLKDNIPTRRAPVLTIGIIVANVLMYFLFQDGHVFGEPSERFNDVVIEYGAFPYELTNLGENCPDPGNAAACRPGDEAPESTLVSLFTSMFMHGSILHLGGNMLFLWIFGNNIEDSMGRLRFVLFYLLGGVVALAAQTALDPNAAIPTIGASGAVAAVLGAYALLYPRARVVTVIFIIIFFTFVELPAVLVLGAWFVFQLLPATQELAGTPAGGVAYFAHIGGFLFGLLFIKAFADRANKDYLGRSRLPVY